MMSYGLGIKTLRLTQTTGVIKVYYTKVTQIKVKNADDKVTFSNKVKIAGRIGQTYVNNYIYSSHCRKYRSS